MTTERTPPVRSAFKWFVDLTLRWNDLDRLGHVNNARYYEFFDTAVLGFLHAEDLGLSRGDAAMVVAENGCRFHHEVVFTDRLDIGLRVERIGTSSVRYGLAAFINGNAAAAADGHFIHVFVDPGTKRPAPFSPPMRRHLETILVPTA
jgi:acyl-CoA thioester hydrolase